MNKTILSKKAVKAFDKWLWDLLCVADGTKKVSDFENNGHFQSFVDIVDEIRNDR